MPFCTIVLNTQKNFYKFKIQSQALFSFSLCSVIIISEYYLFCYIHKSFYKCWSSIIMRVPVTRFLICNLKNYFTTILFPKFSVSAMLLLNCKAMRLLQCNLVITSTVNRVIGRTSCNFLKSVEVCLLLRTRTFRMYLINQ